MFVNMKKKTVLTVMGVATLLTACASVHAAETGGLTVNLRGVQQGGGPLYVSVQKREDFKQERGTSGGIYKNVTGGNMTYTYTDIPVGGYSVMIWHDTNNDGEFSKDEHYMPLDGWGASGPELRGEPKFDDVKINIGANGSVVTIAMHYPK